MSYVLTRVLPGGQEKTSTMEWDRKARAAREAARSHYDNSGGMCGRTGMDAVYDALMEATTGQTVGPFDGYSYQINE